MPRFFVDNIDGSSAYISGDDAKHISKVLRMSIGDEVTLCDGNGQDYIARINNIADSIGFTILSRSDNIAEPTLKLNLYQAIPKLDKMDFIVQKSVELGINQITPVLTQRCISRPNKQSMSRKMERYKKIALSAAKQSGRGIVPEIRPMISYNDAIKEIATNTGILFYEGGGKPLDMLISKSTHYASILIGSEGGFTLEEVNMAKESGIEIATLGNRILRTETAPISAISIIMHLSGNM